MWEVNTVSRLETFNNYKDYLDWFWKARPATTPFSEEEFYRSIRYLGKKDKLTNQGLNNVERLSSKSGMVFYYPYIEIQNSNWLKSALLYWEGIWRMVPLRITPNDNREVHLLLDKGDDLIIGIPPDNYRQAAATRFLKYFGPLLSDEESFFELRYEIEALSKQPYNREFYRGAGQL